jgi:hypothetical protein
MPDLDKFKGTRTKLVDFLTQICLKLSTNQDHFLNEEAMTMYIIFRLDGVSLHQIASFIRGATVDFDSSTELLTYLETFFGHLDPTGTARHELHELKQTRTSVPTSQNSEES